MHPLTATQSASSVTLGRPALTERDGLMRLSAATAAYRRARRAEFARDTRRNVEIILRQFVERTGDPLTRRLHRKHVEQWLESLADELSPSTIRNRVSTVRVFCTWCVAHGHMTHDPTVGIKGPRQPELMPRELVGDEVQRLLAVVPDRRGELMVMLGVVQGMRRGEMASQQREHIDLSGRIMRVHGKANKERDLPICDETLDTILAYLAEGGGRTGPLLRSTTYPQRGLTREYVSKLMQKWMYEAGVKDHAYDGKSTHALRHTFAGTFLDEGGDVRVLQNAMGHTTLTSTFIYTRRKFADGPLRDQMGRRSYREAS